MMMDGDGSWDTEIVLLTRRSVIRSIGTHTRVNAGSKRPAFNLLIQRGRRAGGVMENLGQTTTGRGR